MLLQFHEIGYSQPAHGVLHFVGEAVVYRLCIDAVPGPQKRLTPAERQKPLATEHCIGEQAVHVDPPDSPVPADSASPTSTGRPSCSIKVPKTAGAGARRPNEYGHRTGRGLRSGQSPGFRRCQLVVSLRCGSHSPEAAGPRGVSQADLVGLLPTQKSRRHRQQPRPSASPSLNALGVPKASGIRRKSPLSRRAARMAPSS